MAISEQRLSDLPLLTETEKHQLLVEWNNTKRDYPKDKCIHQLLEEQVERTPDAVALVFEDQQLNYRELNRRANQLAHYLRKLGVGPEVLVGICLERSLEMVVGLLGILKAGGAYVPLDPTYPKKRVEFMLEDSRTAVLLTQQRLVDDVAAYSANVVCLDRDWKDITRQSEENADSEAKPANLAYVIYTSGSTGNPKGVMNIHRGICNRLLWMQDTYHLTEADRVLQKTPFSFDVSVWELFWPLLTGARLVVARPEGHRDAAYLVKLISEQQITTVHFVPSMLRIFLEEQGLERCNCLRHVICSGEALPLEVQERFFARLDAELYNLYGPTEASIDVTFWACKRESDQRIVPIGHPIANMQIYLLDSHLQPVPIGVPGELHIGGVGLARGYLNRAELTAEKFIPNPFPEEPGARLYRTGDIARYLPDGNIEFLGRIDNQVKIRGFRIELGEIEAALSRHPAVRESVVVAREDMYAEKRLAAYVVLNQAQTLAVNDLRSFLKAKLPEYMVPSAFVTLESLPLMPNGKIDRRALPAPNRVEPPLEEVFVAPRTPTEHRLAKIWAEVLGVARVGANDDFFALGGESLKATRVIARVLDLCGAELTHRCFFEAPILSALAERIDSSKPGPPNMRVPFIESANADATVPLSWGQTEIWLMAQLETTLPIYNEPFTIYMNGPVDSLALEKALNEIVRRHKILRTAFTIKESDPVQIIQDGVEIKLSVADLRMVAEPDREKKAVQLCTAEARRPFDLTAPPLVRAMLVRMSETDSRLYLTVHHIVADAYSIYSVLIPELWQLYESIRAGEPSPLPQMRMQYADYARWQHRWLQGEELEKHLTYWRNQLDGVLPLGLPTDRPRSRVRTFNGAYQSFALPKELTNALSALSRREGVTLYMLLLAAFKMLLWRHSQQNEIVIGTAEAGRSRPEFEPLLGHFVNILVLRTKVADDVTFQQFLQQVREVTLEAYAHRHAPFAKLVEELEPNRGTSRHPLFQVAFVMEPPMACHESGWTVSQLDIQTGTSKFDLTLELEERSEAIIGRFEYNTDLFNATTIERTIAHLQTLLEGIVANPDQRICNLPILTTAERHQLLVEWNDTEKDYPKDQCIHELFEEQVKRTPDAVAVVFEGQELSYRDLNAKANQLAHYLKERGVGPEVPVGICLERSLDMVVGLLSILKAGGAYIPLDPQYPSERLAVVLKDSHAPLLLTRQRFVGGLSAYAGQDVCLDTDWEEICRQPVTNPDSAGTADNLAYVIFTSGSTGQPKGVSSTHQAIARLLINTDYIQIEPSDAIAQISNCAFDAATFEIWGALLHGARLVVIPTEVAISPADFAECLNRHRISILFVTTALFNQLVQRNPTIFRDLRHVLFGGEAVDPRWVSEALKDGPPAHLLHVYGPTETTTFASCHEITQVPQGAVTIPIGKPISNTQLYILDRHFQPVPVGIPGEIYIGGNGLARGYLNRPELTAEKFVANPFGADPASRLYKTGDLARYLSDGNIEFIGRIDDQVKIRGFRVEPGEIESVLGQHPSVRETVVIARDDDSGDSTAPLTMGKRLVAYVVPKAEVLPTAQELRSFLKEKLPEYMIPSAFVLLDSFPLTLNAKVDRRALPAPDQTRPELEESFVAPRTPVEEMLADIWAEVLQLESVGIHDNFFGLGGHSLLAMQVISRILGALQVELPLRDLFERPTVAGLAKRIVEVQHQEHRVQSLPILPVPRDKDLPLSFAQQRLWFLDQLEPDSTVYNVPDAVRIRGSLDVAALELSLNEIVRRHEGLRTTFSMAEGEPVQIISPSWSLSLPVVDLTDRFEAEREEEARRLAREEARRPFDLVQGPLLRVTLLRLGHEDHVLLLTLHHIVSDGWSMGVLYRELSVLYQSFCKGQPSPLLDLRIQYGDFAVWQRNWLRGEVLKRQLSYWKKQLENVPAVLNVPTDRPRPAAQSFRGATQSIELSQGLTRGLKILSRQHCVTLFMTLLAAFQTLLQRYSGQDDIVVGSPIASRNRSEIEGLIGFFVNTLVVRTDLSGNPTFQQLLGRVREVALRAYAHQDLPFEKLVEELQPERSLSHSPLFQVMFNMVNVENPEIKLAGTTAELFSSSEPESKFDLTLYVREQNKETHLDLVCNADLFSQDWMTCCLQQYRYLLEQIVRAPEKPIRSYSLVTPESRQLLPDPSAVLADPPQQLVTNVFASWAKQTPKQPAVSQGKQTWTYSELAERANTLARVLRAGGLQPGDVVAVYGVRSFGVIAGMIGTLLSGGVLLPLDYNLPSQRKQLVLREAGAKKLLHVGDQRSREAWLDRDSVPDILFVDPAKGCAVDTETGMDLESITLPELTTDDPAYIFFTSGTTGIPKGVLGIHKGLSHFLEWQRDTFAVGPKDRVAQLTSLSFDAVLRDVFLPLTSGATLCLPESRDTLGADDIISWLERERISILHTVPSLAQSWLANREGKVSLSNMRLFFFVGEPLAEALVRQWRAALPNQAGIVNLYGPTETTLVKCFYRVPADMRPGVQPVGSPLPETQALVLAENHQLCGINESGEIVLRTPFRSRGYVNAPEEAQKRFVKNPFRDDPQDLIYFTGDAGRYRPDGTLEILGRLDDQVKIRGVRIEPAEVTAILARHPAVESCFVVAWKNEQDETSLVAYVVASKQQKTTSTQVRSYLVEQLPAAMVPAFFVFLDSLPLTTNGKVDRQALPEPDHKRSEPEESFVAPRTEIERIVAGIWTEVLKPERVGVHDNFFDLGGHSLLATQVVSRIRGALEVELPLRVLFEKPTVASLSDHIESVPWPGKKNSCISKDNLGETEEIIL